VSERSTDSARAPLALAIATGLVFVAAVPFDALSFLRGPAPYPPEWQWELRTPLAGLPLPALLLQALVLAVLAATGGRRARERERVVAPLAVTAAVALGFALPLTLLAREPDGALRTLLSRTTSNTITSYHSVAISDEARDPLAFLRRHAELLPSLALSTKHAATHPPGAVLFFRGALAVCESSPSLREGLLRTAGVPDREFAWPLTRAARAAALLAALLLNLLAALTAWPLAALARRLGLPPLAAARCALLWALLPGPALIAPRFDAAIALPVVAFAALLLRALTASRPLATAERAATPVRAVALAMAAGACAAAALQLSYGAAAFLAVTGLAVAAAALAAAAAGGDRRRAPAFLAVFVLLSLAAATALALAFGLPALLGGDPLAALRTALAIHRQAYTAHRDYLLWLAFDPVDFAALLGVPLAVLAAAAAAGASRLPRRRGRSALEAFTLSLAGGIALLVASGLTRGEVGRLWIPLMPLVALSATASLEHDARGWRRTLAVGAIVALSLLAVAAAWIL
jgi:hypothetical protein